MTTEQINARIAALESEAALLRKLAELEAEVVALRAKCAPTMPTPPIWYPVYVPQPQPVYVPWLPAPVVNPPMWMPLYHTTCEPIPTLDVVTISGSSTTAASS